MCAGHFSIPMSFCSNTNWITLLSSRRLPVDANFLATNARGQPIHESTAKQDRFVAMRSSSDMLRRHVIFRQCHVGIGSDEFSQ